MRRIAAAALVALTLASCGGRSDKGSSSDGPCVRPPGFRPAGNLLPAKVVPDGMLIGALVRSGGAVSGSTWFPSTLQEAYGNLKAGAVNSGYQLAADDNEGFEAELQFIRAGRDELSFTLKQLEGCSTITGGTFSRKRERARG